MDSIGPVVDIGANRVVVGDHFRNVNFWNYLDGHRIAAPAFRKYGSVIQNLSGRNQTARARDILRT